MTIVIRPVNVWGDEEQDFRRVLRHGLPLKQISKYGKTCDSGGPLASRAVLIGQHTTHHGCSTIGHKDFRLHTLSINSRNSTNCNSEIYGVVLNCHAKNNGACIGDLWRNGKAQWNRDECGRNYCCATRSLSSLYWNLRATFDLSRTIVQSSHAWCRHSFDFTPRFRGGD